MFVISKISDLHHLIKICKIPTILCQILVPVCILLLRVRAQRMSENSVNCGNWASVCVCVCVCVCVSVQMSKTA